MPPCRPDLRYVFLFLLWKDYNDLDYDWGNRQGILFAAVCALILLSGGCHRTQGPAPLARQGVLDLSGWDLEKDGPVDLAGSVFHLTLPVGGASAAAAPMPAATPAPAPPPELPAGVTGPPEVL